jgi:hypothetical protein
MNRFSNEARIWEREQAFLDFANLETIMTSRRYDRPTEGQPLGCSDWGSVNMRGFRPHPPPTYGAGARIMLGLVVPPLLIGLVLGVFAAAGQHSGSRASSSTSSTGTAITTTNPVVAARIGDCFTDDDLARLSLTDYCQTGTYEVVQRFDGTSDPGVCAGLASDLDYPDVVHDIVLCLRYHYYNADEAAHAAPGTCVGQPAGSDEWHPYDCQAGVFTVLGRFYGVSDGGQCQSWGRYDRSLYFSAPGNDRLQMVLCLQYMYSYGGDAGYAQRGHCMVRAADGYLYFPADNTCAGTNVVVTGRSNTYDDEGFCGNDGWLTGDAGRYPELNYTVCWRWR